MAVFINRKSVACWHSVGWPSAH